MDKTLAFYGAAFGWKSPQAIRSTLVYGDKQTTAQRYLGKAGALQLELIQPAEDSDDPYSAHLRRGTHGLIHAGGMHGQESLEGEMLQGEWQGSGETFALYNWLDIAHSFQIRRSI